ncbi:unnamed protein product, partial [Adineta steineri]
MTAPILFNDKKHLGKFSLIWLDQNANLSKDIEQRLRSIINHLKQFQDIEQCHQYIEQSLEQNRLILIVNDEFGKIIIPHIHYIDKLLSIYVYYSDNNIDKQWSSKFQKIKSVVVHIDELISEIKKNFKIQRKLEESFAINGYSLHNQSRTRLNIPFLLSQIFLDSLLRLESNENDQNNLIRYLQHEYENNPNELNNIQQFKENYISNKVLWWYEKKDFFFSSTLNAVLKTENLSMMFLFRSFLFDIQEQLRKYQSKQRLKVYR